VTQSPDPGAGSTRFRLSVAGLRLGLVNVIFLPPE